MQGPACMQKATVQTQCPHVARCQAHRRPWASNELRRTNACKCDSWLREDGRRPAASDTESSSSSVMGSICKAQRDILSSANYSAARRELKHTGGQGIA